MNPLRNILLFLMILALPALSCSVFQGEEPAPEPTQAPAPTDTVAPAPTETEIPPTATIEPTPTTAEPA
ncbi:MAG: hypothetical protein ACOC8X_01520, partial [Chloroflexota bacterium]